MNDTIIVENNSGLAAMVVKVLGNRAVLAILVVLLTSWRLHDWWWREDVCQARYERADRVFKKQISRQNGRTENGLKTDLSRDRRAMALRAVTEGQADARLDRYKGKMKGFFPQDAHGAIQEVQ